MGQFVKWYQEVHADASRDAAEKDRYIFSALASNVKAPYLYASITTAIRNNDEIGLAFERLLFEDWVRSIGRGNFMKNEKVLQYLQHDHDSLDGQKMTRLQLTLDKENHFLFDDFMKLKSTVYLKRSYYQPLLANFKANHDGKVDNKYPNLRHSQTFDIDALTNLDELDRAVTDFKADFGRYLLSKLRIIANDKDISELLQELADTNLMSDSLRKVKAALIASKTSAQPKH
ncbi:uncharacterized protein PHALS_09107 [Plasmopara halstedii]|uniref:Uncharacterized protein n=1 Tax=Plasmopara halstedii TaxID=4781 RepID=A0A0N7L4L9_PLAHL|nr:uncharacterized protein PHALS_09107 [Plasmopara halstedii]CEG39043.1 hypothetical protein PHALS_09107 [Plasmopara halstedii]|eukprot:XP_024575412.1 hypothetical protein PHALS_09107 [Plasmopara halstedii]